MEILKKNLLALIFTGISFIVCAQNETTIQKAFNDSYSLEYQKKYTDAILPLNACNKENNYEINLRLGWLYYLNKNYSQSQASYQKAIDLKPYSIEAKFGIIKPFSALENWEKVLAQYNDILKIDPQNYTANYWAGVLYYNQKKYEVANKYFEKMVNLYPFDFDANHMFAWSCLNNGRTNDAKTLFQKALLIKPGNISCIEGLSKIK